MISWFEKHNKISWAITILIAIIIFYMSALTFPPGSKVGTGINATVYHISIFSLFAFFLSISLIRGKNKKLIPVAIILAIFYALSDEFHQMFVPGRHASMGDIFLDSFGILIASAIYILTLKYRKFKI